VVFGIPVYYVLYNAAIVRTVGMVLLGTTMAAMLKLAWGVIPAYLWERFPTKRRAAGVGFGYSAGRSWAPGSASTSGGRTTFPSSARSRSKACGCPRRSS
jgi:hypothetical protein